MPGPCILSCITLIGTVSISEDGEGRITGIYLPNSNLPCMEDGETDILLEAADQLNEYFSGKRRRFDLPLDYGGTEFRTSVLEALMDTAPSARRAPRTRSRSSSPATGSSPPAAASDTTLAGLR